MSKSSIPTVSKARPTTAGNVYKEKAIGELREAQKSNISQLFTKLKSGFKHILPTLKELSSQSANSIDVAMYLVKNGLFGTPNDQTNSIIRFISPLVDKTIMEETFNLLDKVISHDWQVSEELCTQKFFKNLFESTLSWLEDIKTPSDYSDSGPETTILRRITTSISELKTKFVLTTQVFMKEGGLAFLFHLLRVHSTSYFQNTSGLSFTLINNIMSSLMWRVKNSLLTTIEETSESFQKIASGIKPVNGLDLLFNFFQKSTTPYNQTIQVKNDGICSAIILALIYSNSALPLKYVFLLSPLKNALEQTVSGDTRVAITQAISQLAYVEANRDAIQHVGFGPSVFAVLVKPSSSGLELCNCADVLVNLTNAKSAEVRNELVNAQSFSKLKELIDRLSADNATAETVASGEAIRNAVVIERVFLILANMLIENVTPLGNAVSSNLHTYLIDYLGGINEDAKRKESGNVVEQQKAALVALHSFTFHQSDHIKTLVAYSLLTKLKGILDSAAAELVELAVVGPIYNIAVKGSAGAVSEKGEEQKNTYLSNFRSEGLVTALSSMCLPTAQRTQQIKRFAALTLAQLFRNTKLESSLNHIIQVLKELKNGTDTDLSFKATNALEMLKENSQNSTLIGNI